MRRRQIGKLSMARRAAVCISLLFFILSFAPSSAEQFSRNFEAFPETTPSIDSANDAQSARQKSSLNRLLRGKFAVKSLPNYKEAMIEVPLAGWINQTPFAPYFKYSVYQQISVYRL
jgi:hypothetical protein